MSFLFGKQKTPQERLKQYRRALDRSVRELDRERAALERQEKKLVSDIKKMASANQMSAAKIMAKDLVRTRNYIHKFYKLRSHLQAVGLRLQTLQSNAAMSSAMKGVSKAMMSMNKQINMPQMQKIMMEFEKQSEIMDMKEEMMGDAMDDVMEEDGDEEESEELVNQVLDEIGINTAEQLGSAPGLELPSAEPAAESEVSEMDAELQNRLNNLRNK